MTTPPDQIVEQRGSLTAWPVAAVRAAEGLARASTADGTLMARAAYGLARWCAALLTEHAGGSYGTRVVILAGRGSNGGDALHAGALLARRGAAVTALLAAADAGVVHQPGLAALLAADGRVICVGDESVDGEPHPASIDASLIVDGLVGIGGRGALREPGAGLARHATAARSHGTPVVAVDMPSGVDADNGAVVDPDGTVVADLTVTFGCLKPGLLLAPGTHYAGGGRVADMGLGQALTEGGRDGNVPTLRATCDADVARVWPMPAGETDKYDRGVLGIAAGSATYPGAALLAAGGALAGPIGMLRCVGDAARGVVQRFPEAGPGTDVATVGRVQAWVVGPGLGTGEHAETTLRSVLDAGLPTVIDGDAITLLAGLLTRREAEFHAPVVLTPHRREFTRLVAGCGVSPAESEGSLATARRIADRLGATVLLKGSRTLIVTPGYLSRINLTGSSVLATAGSGDVLAGLLGALLAAGCGAHDAAAVAAHLHGLAGLQAVGTGTVTARALVETLPAVVTRLTSGVTSGRSIVHN